MIGLDMSGLDASGACIAPTRQMSTSATSRDRSMISA